MTSPTRLNKEKTEQELARHESSFPEVSIFLEMHAKHFQ